jgi:hypothetical protein
MDLLNWGKTLLCLFLRFLLYTTRTSKSPATSASLPSCNPQAFLDLCNSLCKEDREVHSYSEAGLWLAWLACYASFGKGATMEQKEHRSLCHLDTQVPGLQK